MPSNVSLNGRALPSAPFFIDVRPLVIPHPGPLAHFDILGLLSSGCPAGYPDLANALPRPRLTPPANPLNPMLDIGSGVSHSSRSSPPF